MMLLFSGRWIYISLCTLVVNSTHLLLLLVLLVLLQLLLLLLTICHIHEFLTPSDGALFALRLIDGVTGELLSYWFFVDAL